MALIGIDFSINKPAACVFSHNKYKFFGWPYGVKSQIIDLYRSSGVQIINRTDNKEKGEGISDKMRYEVENAEYLSDLIISSLKEYLNSNTYIAFEGLSYASSGDVVLQLGGYKYILMSRLREYVPLKNMFTYSPITIKSVAECAKRGMTKADMIEKFIETDIDCKFRQELSLYREQFQTVKSKNWIIHLDDFVDSFWTLQTLRKKENI